MDDKTLTFGAVTDMWLSDKPIRAMGEIANIDKAVKLVKKIVGNLPADCDWRKHADKIVLEKGSAEHRNNLYDDYAITCASVERWAIIKGIINIPDKTAK